MVFICQRLRFTEQVAEGFGAGSPLGCCRSLHKTPGMFQEFFLACLLWRKNPSVCISSHGSKTSSGCHLHPRQGLILSSSCLFFPSRSCLCWQRPYDLPLPADRERGIHRSDSVYTAGGLARGRSPVRRLRPASISEAPGRQRLSGPTAARTDYKGGFYIIRLGPAPSPPSSSLRLLMTNRTWQSYERLVPRRRGTPGSPHGQRPPGGEGGTLASNPLEKRGRSVSERASRRAIELIEINIHDWTRGAAGALGSLCQHQSPFAAGRRRLVDGGGGATEWQGSHGFSPGGVAATLAATLAYQGWTRTPSSKAARSSPSLSINPSRPRPLLAPPAGRR